jgi:hypothetical protein
MKRSILMVSAVASVVCVSGYNFAINGVSHGSKEVAEAAEVAAAPVQIIEADELMKLLIDPTFEDLKDSIENPPEKRKDWRSLYIAAFSLAELNNLYLSRTGEDYMESDEWTEYVLKARAGAIDLAETVRARPDYTVLKEKFTVVMQSCNDCHTKFSADADIDEIEPPLSWLK